MQTADTVPLGTKYSRNSLFYILVSRWRLICLLLEP
jgi:hypothetical protein